MNLHILIIVHVRIMFSEEFISVIVFYDSYYDKIKQLKKMIKKRFKFVNKCDTCNTCIVYVWTPVPIACPFFISL